MQNLGSKKTQFGAISDKIEITGICNLAYSVGNSSVWRKIASSCNAYFSNPRHRWTDAPRNRGYFVPTLHNTQNDINITVTNNAVIIDSVVCLSRERCWSH